MKLYRALDYSKNELGEFWRRQNFREGKYNEIWNLIEARSFSPSSQYLIYPQAYKSACHSFLIEKELVKFFYPSLLDALKYSFNFYPRVIILEIDLPLDKIKNYLGLGFYTNENRMEICLPYRNLYQLTRLVESPNLEKTLTFLENNLNFFAEDINLWSQSLDNEPTISNLLINGSSQFYPYLCYKSGVSFDILNAKAKNKKMLKMMVNSINENRPKDYFINVASTFIPNKDFFIQEGIPYLEKENDIIKKILIKNNEFFKTYFPK